jgi:hypothetical protein
MIEEEKFFAWLDGELPADEAAEMEALVAADPRLVRRAEEHRALAGRLRTAFDPIAAAPMPSRLTQSIRPGTANVIEFASWRDRLARPFSGPIPQWAAIAATLVLGIVLGTTLDTDRTASPIEVRGGAVYAAGAVDDALNRQLANVENTADVRIGLTFRDRAGAICRTFQDSASAGLACRADGHWRLRGLFAAPEGATAEYRMAAGADPRLLEMVDSSIAGEPFDETQEKAARDIGWK